MAVDAPFLRQKRAGPTAVTANTIPAVLPPGWEAWAGAVLAFVRNIDEKRSVGDHRRLLSKMIEASQSSTGRKSSLCLFPYGYLHSYLFNRNQQKRVVSDGHHWFLGNKVAHPACCVKIINGPESPATPMFVNTLTSKNVDKGEPHIKWLQRSWRWVLVFRHSGVFGAIEYSRNHLIRVTFSCAHPKDSGKGFHRWLPTSVLNRKFWSEWTVGILCGKL